MPFEWTSDNLTLAIQIGFAALALFVFINWMVAKTLGQLATPERYLTVQPGGHEGIAADPDYAWIAQWSDANGFQPDVVLDFDLPGDNTVTRIMVWKNDYKKTFLAAYHRGSIKYQEFVTLLQGDGILCTSGTRDAGTLPTPPGSFLQVFHGADLSYLAQQHEAALLYLYQNRGLKLVESWKSTPELIVESLRRQIAYIKTLPLWQMRGLYWNFVRKYRLSNRTVEERYGAEDGAGLKPE